ncbi:hypothetical protein [Streptomyces sp. MBT53]|uniref:hypothetical protein n=1 Tax=Streptomyces sp. MBT53 TaxID=1488384 RepID=UPI001912F3E6|nr:hypothetical protein [Streptomyces sp. MBT53]MBK6019196.1 hypothetical protein [Streptomyces sp. MBT53]
MIWPAALSGAALRVTRTAVGRRVLQLALLVGGLCALGLLCGGQAQAADGVLGTPVSLGRPGIPVAASAVKPVPVRVQVPVLAPVLDPVLDPVVAPVVAPVSDTVEQVVRPVSDVVTKTVTAVLAEAPSLPTLPSVPVVPSQPVPPVQEPPAHTAPVAVPTPVRSTPQPSGDGHRSGVRPAETAVGTGVTYGPRVAGGADEVGALGHAAVRHAPSVRRAPVRQAPGGDPDGAPRDQQAVDGGGARHCDAQAVTSGHRVAVRFVRGVAEGADAAETRDRYRDVPVFPG